MGHQCWKAALAVLVVVGCGGGKDGPQDAATTTDGSSEIVLDPCTSNRDCAGGEVCREGFCRVACEDAAECSAPLTLCDDTRGYCVECIDDDDCTTHASCEASFCTFFCRDDTACAADEYCIRDSGTCAERECESARECDGGFRCEGYVCVPIDDLVCEADEEACSEDATSALRCNADGTMETRETCDMGTRCVIVDDAAVCREVVCTADERGCADDDTAFACDATGTERTETECEEGRRCDAGACVARVCTPGVARCDASGAREVCDDGTGYVASPCASTDVCVDGVCLERVCERGGARCVEGSSTGREVCADDERSWTNMPCGASESCSGGACETRVCTPTVAECVGSGGSRECLATGLGYDDTVACPIGQSCNPATGRCGAWICTPGSASCESVSTLRTCNADGLDHSTSDCAATESCSAGACRTRVCVPGAFSCTDVDTRRVCAADGLSYTSAPCTGSDPDGYSCTGAGTCVARACVPGSVDTTCASLTDRRVCNADGSAYLVVGCAAGQSCDAGVCAVRCGDGVVGGSEACDDGNLRDGDACSSVCAAAPPLEHPCDSTRYHPLLVGTTTGERMGWHVADLDGDGHLDLLGVEQAGNRMVAYYGDGGGRFSGGTATSTGRNNGPAVIADLDGDGDRDVVLAQPDSNRLALFERTGTGYSSRGFLAQGSTGRDLAALDYDHDGDRDLLVYLAASSCLALRENRGGFSFGEATCVLSIPGSPYNAKTATLDWDGDGYEDLAEVSTLVGSVVIHRSVAGALIPSATIPFSGSRNIQAIDVQRDGVLELAMLGPEAMPTISWHLAGGRTPSCVGIAPSTTVGVFFGPTDQARAAFAGDFNEDGVLDWVRRDGGDLWVDLSDPYADLVRAHDAIAYWPLDELIGGITPDVLGTWPATAHGGVTVTGGLHAGSSGALRTNGSDAYLEPMADTSAFQAVPFSVELWFRRETSERFDLVVSTRSVGAAGWDLFFHDGTSQHLVFELGDGAWYGTAGVSIAVGAVVHLVATYDGATARLYVDGVEASAAAARLSPSSVPFRIGAGVSTEGNPSGYTHATFDDVAVYDRALTPSEIVQHAAMR